MNKESWVQAWGQSHSALSFFYYPSCQKTYRLIVNTAVSGEKLRVSFSNAYGKNDVEIGAVTAAPCTSYGSVTGKNFTELTFNGKISFTLRKNERLTSDPIDFSISDGEYFCISVYVTKGDLTSGNLMSNAELITAKGNRTRDAYCANESRPRDTVRSGASKLLGMPFPKPIPLFDSIELFNTEGAKAIVVLGDSISQQGYWTNPFEKRLREAFPGKYSLINKSVMGNRLLYDCSPLFPAKGLFGRRAIQRLHSDILNYDGTEYVIICIGINDVFQHGTINAPAFEKPDPDDVFKAICDIAEQLHAHSIKAAVFNLIAFGAAPDATKEKDEMRRKVNNLLAENADLFDGFFDFNSAGVDPDNDYFTRIDYLGPDKLHPNPMGGEAFANAIDIDLFK
ncbi:MAG: hypothetical protein IJC37_02725 [Clostridia bacterium]|nr:hypothetical protein [Clostridia bacterium]